MVDFRAIVDNLVDMGFYSVILPFILVYAVVFAILQKAGIFLGGKEDHHVRSVNAVVAFVFALFVVASIQIVTYIQNLIVLTVAFIMFILCLLIVLGLVFGSDYTKLIKDNPKVMWTIAGIIFFVLLMILLVITGAWDAILDWFDGASLSENVITWLVILGIVGVLYWVSKDGGN